MRTWERLPTIAGERRAIIAERLRRLFPRVLDLVELGTERCEPALVRIEEAPLVLGRWRALPFLASRSLDCRSSKRGRLRSHRLWLNGGRDWLRGSWRLLRRDSRRLR